MPCGSPQGNIKNKDMTPKAFQALIAAKIKEAENAISRRLPILIGKQAKDFYKNNFKQGGFVNNGLHPWPKTQCQKAGSPYGALMSQREYLRRSIRYVPGTARVVVGTTVPYAAIHNEGGIVTSHPQVTPKMRKYAWRQFFDAGGGKGKDTPEASKWKALALTKKQKLTITSRIPQRQFIGHSKELDDIIYETIDKEFTRISKS